MNDQKLQKIQDEIMAEIDKEQSEEADVMESAEEIAAQLMVRQKINAELNGTVYMFNYRCMPMPNDKKLIYLLVANTIKYKIVGEKYMPFTASAEMDMSYSEQDNLKTVVEAFIRHITGRVKVGTLEE